MPTTPIEAPRPLPDITPLTEPFWSAARRHELVMQRCTDCGAYRFPPERGCFECGSAQAEWHPVEPRGTLFTWTVVHPPVLPYFAGKTPFPVAVVELECGVRMVTELRAVPVEAYRSGMPVEASFEDIDDRLALVHFVPRPG